MKPRCVALGTFDGVHRGHKHLLQLAISKRSTNGCASVFTFDYPPEKFFLSDRGPYLISDFDKRQELIFSLGIDEIVWAKFNKSFAQILAEEFIINILIRALRVEHIICGFNFRFGHKATGTPQLLEEYGKKYGFTIDVLPPYQLQGYTINSTRIRNAIKDGNLLLANKLLGRPLTYCGQVLFGRQLGRKLGFPTANLEVNIQVLIPKDGVYLTRCKLPDETVHPSLTSISDNPTFNGNNKTIETHILNYNGPSLYGKTIELEFLEQLRNIKRFSTEEELVNQLYQDKEVASKKFKSFTFE